MTGVGHRNDQIRYGAKRLFGRQIVVVDQAAFPHQTDVFGVPGAREKLFYFLQAAIASEGLFEGG
jgi:hypothetical protein